MPCSNEREDWPLWRSSPALGADHRLNCEGKRGCSHLPVVLPARLPRTAVRALCSPPPQYTPHQNKNDLCFVCNRPQVAGLVVSVGWLVGWSESELLLYCTF